MTQDHDEVEGPPTDALRRALRDHYAPPADPEYWTRLERRIMTVVAADRPREWWSHFPGWIRLGVAAAAAAALVALLANRDTRASETRTAAEHLLGPASEVPLLTDLVPGEARDAREATLRYLITHD